MPNILNNHFLHLKTKYSNMIINYDITIQIPHDLLIKNNINDLQFNTINNDHIINNKLFMKIL